MRLVRALSNMPGKSDLPASTSKTLLLVVVAAIAINASNVPEQAEGEYPFIYYLRSTENGAENVDGSVCSRETPCSSFEHIANMTTAENVTGSVEIIILSTDLYLSDLVVFSGFAGVRITGAPTDVTCTIKDFASTNSSQGGLALIAVRNVTLEDLDFIHCGSIRNYSIGSDWRPILRSALHIVKCVNVNVNNTRIFSSTGAGITITDTQCGAVKLLNSQFIGNRIPDEEIDQYKSCGGVCIYAWQYCGKPSEFIFHNCLFLNNRAANTDVFSFVTSLSKTFRGRGRGGGLGVQLFGLSAFNTINISMCNFTKNSAHLGGGLSITMRWKAHNNLVVVENTTIEKNSCHPRAGSGGGAHLGYSYESGSVQVNVSMDRSSPARDNHFLVQGVFFRENCAELGGGSTFFSSRSQQTDINNTITFSNCTWAKNTAHIGAAVDVSPHTDERFERGFLPIPVFADCYFIENNIRAMFAMELQTTASSGVLSSSLFDITFNTSVYFEGNSGSALVMVNGVADFSACNATFVNNTGVQGAAIALIGVSSMLVGPGHSYEFINNRASNRGGAIYSSMIDSHDFAVSRSCFILYSDELGTFTHPTDWEATFRFQNNVANSYGQSIFATSLIPCQPRDGDTGDLPTVFQWPGVFEYERNTSDTIATEGGIFNVSGDLPFMIIPGEEHLLQVAVIDDLNQTVNTSFIASIMEEDREKILIDDAFSCVAGNVIQLQGEEGQNGTLLLQTVTSRQTSIAIEIVLAACPPAFSQSEINECVCDADSFVGLGLCDQSLQVQIRPGFWAGYTVTEADTSEFATAACPLGFCNKNNGGLQEDITLPRNLSLLDETICGPKRTGILCGKCAPGYTTHYHSPDYQCKKANLCNVGWLFYILSELFPTTLLFLVIITLNISFTSGAVNSLILFIQLLDTLFVNASGKIEFSTGIDVLTAGYRLMYGIFNLDFFNIDPLSYCIFGNATVLDVLAFKYVTIIYALILVLSVIAFIKYCSHRCLRPCLVKYVGIQSLKVKVDSGLSAFIIICYAQCVKISLTLLLPETLKGRGGVLYHPNRVWFNGEIKSFSAEHLPYALPALLFLITIGIIFPAVLLTYRLINKAIDYFKIGELKLIMSITSNLSPLVYSFQGSFKSEWCFFAGLYLVYRWIGLVAYAALQDFIAFYAAVEFLLITILTLHAVVRPYEQNWHNIVDVLLLADLALINGLSMYNYYYYTQANVPTDYSRVDATASIQIILIFLPLLCYVVGYSAYRVWKKGGEKKLCFPKEDEAVISRPRVFSTSSVIDLQDLRNQDDDPFSDEPLPHISNEPPTISPAPTVGRTDDDHHCLPPLNSPPPCKTSDDLTTGPLPQPASEPPQPSDSDHELPSSNPISDTTTVVIYSNEPPPETPTKGPPPPVTPLDISTNCLPLETSAAPTDNRSPSHETIDNNPSPPE